MSDVKIELPQYENETIQAYEARVLYVCMGPERSILKAAEQLGKHRSQLGRWSMLHGWIECAKQYDEMMASIQIQQKSAEYRAQISEHRQQAMVLGGELMDMGRAMATEIMQRMSNMHYKPSDLQTAVKAILYGMDMRAHALELDRILEQDSSGDYFE
jgi:hypothetical protein